MKAPAVGHQGIVGLSWTAGPTNRPAAVTNSDIARIAAGDTQKPYVLLDPAGAGACH